jgi:peptidoglycan/LPS O-acetylase OafA/YrhL
MVTSQATVNKVNQSSFYVPALDGIRAISILMVIISHMAERGGFKYGKMVPGGMGVTVFFFISGYLITALLFKELYKTNTINFKAFFLRRILRLYPPLLLMLTILLSYILIIGKPIPYTEVFASLFYYENYFMVYSAVKDKYFGVIWSLSIEEHFYLVWPVLFIVFNKSKKGFTALAVLLIIIPLICRLYIASQYDASKLSDLITYYLTHCRFDAIAFGCLSAVLLNYSSKEDYIKLTQYYFSIILAIILLLVSLTFRNEFFRQTYRYTLQGIALFILLPGILSPQKHVYTAVKNALSGNLIVFIGKLSYSIYLFHWVAIQVTPRLLPQKYLWLLVNIVITIVLSLFSYLIIEKPLMKFKNNINALKA